MWKILDAVVVILNILCFIICVVGASVSIINGHIPECIICVLLGVPIFILAVDGTITWIDTFCDYLD